MIVLSGYMGSGKSVIGKELARKLNYSFVDLDEEIEKNQGMKIPEIFSSKGEIYFRKIEIEVLKSCLKLEENTILALGGGTPCYGQNLEMIKKNPDTRLIYLKVDLKTLTARLFPEKNHRPLISNIKNKEQLDDFLRKHLFERQFYYMQSDFIIDATTDTPQQITNEIINRLNASRN